MINYNYNYNNNYNYRFARRLLLWHTITHIYVLYLVYIMVWQYVDRTSWLRSLLGLQTPRATWAFIDDFGGILTWSAYRDHPM